MGYLTVTILDTNKQFLEYAHPALARKLIKEGYARVYSNDPFVIQLSLELSTKIRNGLIRLRDIV